MSRCDTTILSAYLDGELSADARAEVERHLFDCRTCARELASLRELSQLIAKNTPSDLTPDELSRFHQAVDDSADTPIFRLGGVLGTIAASILIIASAWMLQMPSQAPSRLRSQKTALQPWEQVAVTLRVEPPLPDQDRDRIEFADAMVNGLLPIHP